MASLVFPEQSIRRHRHAYLMHAQLYMLLHHVDHGMNHCNHVWGHITEYAV